MNLDEAVAYWGSQSAVARAAGCSIQAVSKWKTERGGQIPTDWQVVLQRESGGAVVQDHWELLKELEADYLARLAQQKT